MFRKLRIRIIAAIMSVLIVVFAGTLALIYFASYKEVKNENFDMLEEYSEEVLRSGSDSGTASSGSSLKRRNHEQVYGLTTFYYVMFTQDGAAEEIENSENSGLSDAELTEYALTAASGDKETGSVSQMLYYVSDTDCGKTLVTFMNDSVTQSSFSKLFRNALVFGCCTIVILFFISWYLAVRIVRPLEDGFNRQKQFVSDASHELKTPISVVSANAELLGREVGENKWLGNIRAENDRMAGLVDQLLQLAKTESAPPVFSEVDMSRAVKGGALPFESVAFEKNVSLELDIDDGVCVSGNAEQLQKLTSILTDNAIGHTPEGGAVTICLKDGRSAAALSVSNDGEDIPAELREKIFERFYRADESRSGSGHYGIGLAVAKAVVTAHGGKISVDCAGGRTTFTAVIPHGSRRKK